MFVFLQNMHLQEKIILYGKKNYIDFFLFTEKAFFTQNEKNIYLI